MSDMPSFQDIIQRAQQVRERLALAQQDLAAAEVTGSAGGGQVVVTMRGDGTITKIVIDQAAVDNGDAQAISALTLTAITHATDTIRSMAQQRIAAVSGDLHGALAAGDGPR